MKFFFAILIIFLSKEKLFGQSIDLFGNVYFMDFSFADNKSSLSSAYNKAKNFNILKYNLGVSYISKKNIERSIAFGFFSSSANRDRMSLIAIDTSVHETFKQDISRGFNFYNFRFGLGKKISIGNTIMSATINVPFEITSKWENVYSSQTQDTIRNIHVSYFEKTKLPNLYSTGLILMFSVCHRILANLYASFSIGTGFSYNSSIGKEYYYSKDSNLITNNVNVRDEIYETRNVWYDLPIQSNITFSYSFFAITKKIYK